MCEATARDEAAYATYVRTVATTALRQALIQERLDALTAVPVAPQPSLERLREEVEPVLRKWVLGLSPEALLAIATQVHLAPDFEVFRDVLWAEV